MADRKTKQQSPRRASMSPAMLLEIFDEPIVFQRAYVGITGSATAALYLSYAVYQTERLEPEEEGWFVKTADDWHADTGLTRFEQQTARRVLRDLGILIERRVGMPAKLWQKISGEQLLELLAKQADERWGSALGR